MGADYYLAFTTGLLGGFGHCIGMCGPIVVSLVWKRPEGDAGLPGMLSGQLLYHAGRIVTYALVGAIMGLSGSFVNTAARIGGVQNVIAVAAGCLMVLLGLGITGLGRGAAWIEGRGTAVLRAAQELAGAEGPGRSFGLGIVLGLLPCGLSYTIFIAAAGTGGALPGAAVAALFGFGTLPAVLLFGALTGSVSSILRGWLYRAGGITVTAMGLLFIYRGVRHHAGL